MKGDFTRFTFEPKKHYTSVRMQQGRVQLDSDWNEQADIQTHLTQSVAKDMIGACGAAKTTGGFQIKPSDNHNLSITPGHIYVDGILCELEQETNYTNQPDYPNPDFTKKDSESSSKLKLNLTSSKYYLAYLDVWQRHITAIEDTNIREVGLNGPDTTTRTKTIWQVKLLPLENNAWETSQEWQKLTEKRDIFLKVDDSSASGGEGGWKNELCRVEIHKPGTLGTATFKWSCNNASLVFPVTKVKENYIELEVTSRSISDSFQANQWVEITNDVRELQGEPGTLVRLTGEISGNRIYFSPDKVFNDSSDSETFPEGHNLKVRAWDHPSDSAAIITNSQVILSENGFKLEFTGSSEFTTGDYWLIPTRTVKVNNHNILWLFDGLTPLLQPPDGIKHHYCPLALLSYEKHEEDDNENFTLEVKDLRSTFPSLSNCLDKTGDIMTGTLEIRDNLFVTGEDSKVGIGTDTPETKLDVVGKAKIADSLGIGTAAPPDGLSVQGNFLLATTDGEVSIGTDTTQSQDTLAVKGNTEIDGTLKVTNNNNFVFATTEDNKVGIGTETPQAKLEVFGNAKVTESLGIATDIEENSTDKLAVTGNTNLDGKLKVTQDTFLATTNDYNVGIGTQNPEAKLEVVGATKISGLTQIFDGDFQVNENALIATTSDSQVKIGNEVLNSTAKLAVKGNTNIDGNLQVTNNSNVVLATTNDNKIGIDTATPQQKLVINNGKVGIGYNEPNQTATLAIKDNLGIGTTQVESNQKLVVEGDTYFNGELEVTKNVSLATTNNSKVSIGRSQTSAAKLGVVGNTTIGSLSYVNSKVAAESGLLVEGKTHIGDQPPVSNQEATEAQLYVKGNTYIDGEVYATDINFTGSRLRNSSYFGIVDTQATDALIINPDLAYQAIALYNSVGINNGGLAVGELSSLPNGELKVIKSAFLATNGGNVGVGTSQLHPNTLLGVKGSTSIGEAYLNQAAPSNGLIVQGNVGIGTSSPDSATTLDVAGKVKIRDGVGIGTQAPDSGLAVEGQVEIGRESNQNNEIKLFVRGNTEIGGELQATEHAFLATAENTQVSIGTSQQPQGNNLLGVAGNTTIGSSYASTKPAPPNGLLVEGKVQIGDKPPVDNQAAKDAQLYVRGNAYIDGEIYAENIRTTGSRLRNSSGFSIVDTQFTDSLIVNPDSEYQAIILYNSVGIGDGGLAVGELSSLPDGELKVTNSTFLATNSGNVGIGTDSPDSDTKLDVVGNVRVAGGMGIGTTAPESGVRVNGIIEADTVQTETIIARNFIQESSREYKNNITNLSIQESKQILDNLKPVKYSYRTDSSQKLHAGFIAEESHDLFTSADKTMLNSTGIIAILTSVLKEQMYENSDLNRLILQQQQDIDQLSIRLRKIEKSVV